MPILLDLTPLRVSPAYRRLFTGFTLAGVGSQLTIVAIGLQVYALTGSSFSVGLVGLFALVPIIIMGLYGGALIDAHDRRTVALVASGVMWASGILTTMQAWLGNTNPLVLYLLVAVNSAGFAVVSPARSAIYPRLLERRLLPAANALTVFAFNVALTVGPLLAGFLVAWRGYTLAYSVDVVLFTSAIWGLRTTCEDGCKACSSWSSPVGRAWATSCPVPSRRHTARLSRLLPAALPVSLPSPRSQRGSGASCGMTPANPRRSPGGAHGWPLAGFHHRWRFRSR